MKNECDNYYIARIQRQNEIQAGRGTSGTMGFESRGCYECKVNNQKCSAFSNYLTKDKRREAIEKYERGKNGRRL